MRIVGTGTELLSMVILTVTWSCNKIVKDDDSWDWDRVTLCDLALG